jgi:hypothetical protein
MSKRLTTEEFIKRAKEVHGDKYDYSLVDYKNNNTKVKIICPKHGVFEQRAADHLSGYGCKKCHKENFYQKLTAEEFIKRAKEVHGDKYDYSLVDYKGCQTKVKIICPIHGEFEQEPTAHINQKQDCPFCAFQKRAVKNSLSKQTFITRANKIYGNKYKYDLSNYSNSYSEIEITCPIHGIFIQKAYNFLRGCDCQKCNSSSKGEDKIIKLLNGSGLEFISQKNLMI